MYSKEIENIKNAFRRLELEISEINNNEIKMNCIFQLEKLKGFQNNLFDKLASNE